LVSTGHVAVAVLAGRVTLCGYVTSNAQRDAARAAALRVKGVEQLANDITVAVPCPATADPPAAAPEVWPLSDAPQPSRAFNTMHMTKTGGGPPQLRP
jgi:hypothetical protein